MNTQNQAQNTPISRNSNDEMLEALRVAQSTFTTIDLIMKEARARVCIVLAKWEAL